MIKRLCLFILLFLSSCAFGPTPERVGFDYPAAGIRFSPRRGLACRTSDTAAEPLYPDKYQLLFPRMTGIIEESHRRILFSGVKGDVTIDTWPLYDELSVNYFGADAQYTYERIEENDMEVPWSGVTSKLGKYRLFHMIPIPDMGGTEQYSFAVTIKENGNTYEVLWRDSQPVPPDEGKIETFFQWTRGLRFIKPEPVTSETVQ